jgi:hypothetical protein
VSSLAHHHERVELSQAPDRTYGATPMADGQTQLTPPFSNWLSASTERS